jgi:hypothetical protein
LISPQLKEEYLMNEEKMIKKNGPEFFYSVGAAKILTENLSLNTELSNIINIYSSAIYALFPEELINKHIKYIFEGIADLGCSMGSLNRFFNSSEFVDIPKIKNIEEFSSLITMDEYVIMLRETISKIEKIILDNKSDYLAFEFTDGVTLEEEGNGDYFPELKIHYLVNFILKNKNIKFIKDVHLDDEIVDKCQQINFNRKAPSYEKKYLKYKNKYLQLKNKKYLQKK